MKAAIVLAVLLLAGCEAKKPTSTPVAVTSNKPTHVKVENHSVEYFTIGCEDGYTLAEYEASALGGATHYTGPYSHEYDVNEFVKGAVCVKNTK